MPFVKGHGTENDFVLLPDPHRPAGDHAGCRCGRCATGGPGSAPTASSGSLRRAGAAAPFVMDYRNADGSLRRDVRQRRPGVRPVPGARRLGASRAASSSTPAAGCGRRTVPASATSPIGMGPADVGGARPAAARDGAEFTGRVRRRRQSAPGVCCYRPDALAALDLTQASPSIRPSSRTGPTSSSCTGRPAGRCDGVGHAGARTGRGRDPVVRHRHRCGGGCAPLRAGRRRPERCWFECPAAPSGRGGRRHCLLTGPAVIVARGVIDAGFWPAAR